MIKKGAVAGHCFKGQADLQVAYHVTDARGRKGYLMIRKRLIDKKAFEYDPQLGWEVDRWFEWPEVDE